MALAQGWTDLAKKIQADYEAGVPTRTGLGTKGAAFAWASGLPQSVGNYLTTMQITGRSVPIGSVALSASPPAIVAPGAPKPNAVTVAVNPVALKKFAGVGEAQLEQQMDAAGLIPAIANVIAAGAVLAFEADAITTIDGATTQAASATTWSEAILEAQGIVVGNGGSPGVLIVSAADYAAIVGDLASMPGFAIDPRSPVGQYMGSAVHVSPKATAGKAFVLDPSAFVAIESEGTPMVLVDPFSKASSNVAQVVVDIFAAVGTINAALAVEVTVGV